MIEETVFNNLEEIKEFILDKYGMISNNIIKLDRGSANIYKIDNTYILKEFQSKYSKEDIIKEIKIINHLRKDNISVPEYIKTINNEFYTLYKEKVIIIERYIDGYTIEPNTGNYKKVIGSAGVLGKIIKSLETINLSFKDVDINCWVSKELLLKGLEKHTKLLKYIKNNSMNIDTKVINNLKCKISMLNNLIENFDDFSFDLEDISIKVSHGDYNVMQFIYNNDKIISVLDFISASKLPIVWEIIRSYSYIDINAKDGKIDISNLKDYIKEVNKYIKLSNNDLKIMPYLYMFQLLSSTYGYKEYIYNNKKDLLEFAYFRTNLATYLFNNAELISNRLLENLNN